MNRRGRCLGAMVVAMGLLTIGAGVGSAQDVELARVEGLVAQGRFEEGRDVLQSWFDRGWGSAVRVDREHAIWLRALLTIDPSMAEVDFRRLTVEYPGGRYTDGALFRLAQAAEARGESERARGFLLALLRDHPSSPLRMDARALELRLP